MTPPGGPRARKLDPEAARDLRPDDPVRAWYDALLKGGYFMEAGPEDGALRRVQAALDALRRAEEEKVAASLPPAIETGEVHPGLWLVLGGAVVLATALTNLIVALATVAMLGGTLALMGLAWRVWVRVRLRERRAAAEERRRRAGEEIRVAVDDTAP